MNIAEKWPSVKTYDYLSNKNTFLDKSKNEEFYPTSTQLDDVSFGLEVILRFKVLKDLI